MNEASERMKSWLAGADQKRADACLTWLRGHLAIGLFDGSSPLDDAIRQDTAGYLRLLTDNPSMYGDRHRIELRTTFGVENGTTEDEVGITESGKELNETALKL